MRFFDSHWLLLIANLSMTSTLQERVIIRDMVYFLMGLLLMCVIRYICIEWFCIFYLQKLHLVCLVWSDAGMMCTTVTLYYLCILSLVIMVITISTVINILIIVLIIFDSIASCNVSSLTLIITLCLWRRCQSIITRCDLRITAIRTSLLGVNIIISVMITITTTTTNTSTISVPIPTIIIISSIIVIVIILPRYFTIVDVIIEIISVTIVII